MERIAEALTGSAVPLLTGWYPKVATGREMANGDAVAAECDRHPDPICEAIRWQICEGELVQIIGRARGVNRTEADPVDVLVMTDAPLPLPLDSTVTADDLAPGPAELMLGMAGIAFESATDMATGLSQDWGSGGGRHLRVRVVGWLELLSEAGAERAVVDGATNLQQQVGAASRPAHLL